MRKGGLEPPRPRGHWNLNPARLPNSATSAQGIEGTPRRRACAQSATFYHTRCPRARILAAPEDARGLCRMMCMRSMPHLERHNPPCLTSHRQIQISRATTLLFVRNSHAFTPSPLSRSARQCGVPARPLDARMCQFESTVEPTNRDAGTSIRAAPTPKFLQNSMSSQLDTQGVTRRRCPTKKSSARKPVGGINGTIYGALSVARPSTSASCSSRAQREEASMYIAQRPPIAHRPHLTRTMRPRLKVKSHRRFTRSVYPCESSCEHTNGGAQVPVMTDGRRRVWIDARSHLGL